MDLYLVVLRIVHIVAGAFWVGASVTFALFLEPTAVAVGPSSGSFMTHLTKAKRFPEVIGVVSLANLVAGVLLYWEASSGFDGAWISSDVGLGFTVGAVSAIASWIIGFTVLRPGVSQIGPLSSAMAAGEAGAAQRFERLQHRLKRASVGNVGLVLFAAAVMASARYL